MPFAAALSTAADVTLALDEVCRQVATSMNKVPADLAIVFFSPHHLDQADFISSTLRANLHPGMFLGCVAEAVIGNDREIEQRPALALWVGKWNRSNRLTPFHLSLEQTADGPSLMGYPDALFGEEGPTRDFLEPARKAVIVLGDPYSFPPDALLSQMNESAPGVPVLGGMASGITGRGQCRLLLGDQIYDQGAVCLQLEGDLGLRWIVSQGCRPIGKPMVITKAQENVILELGGKTPFQHLKDLWESLTAHEQDLFKRGLHIGRVLNEYRAEFQRGDFLVRNVMGIEKQSGALIITDHVRVGQTVQFHVRDAQSADEDLHELLQMDLNAHEAKPAGALVFSCNGRGTRLFDQPHHDASVIQQEAGPIPLAGFFAMGEIGPIGGQNFIHGFTASVVLFED